MLQYTLDRACKTYTLMHVISYAYAKEPLMKMPRGLAWMGIGVVAAILAGCGGTGGGPAATEAAAGFPTGDIRMIVSYAAGGPTDVAGRAIAKFLEKELKTSVVVENKDGASGAVGTAQVAKAPKDGYTIGMTTGSAVARVPLFNEVGYDLKDIQTIGVGTFGPGLIVVEASSPYKSLDDLVAAAKAKPGGITLATGGTSTPQHVEVVRWDREYGVKFKSVPFKGEAPAVTALLGKNVDGAFISNAQTTMAQVSAGKFRVIATAAPDRLPSMPDVPTLKESGFDNLVYGNSYFIFIAPAGIPDSVLRTLEGGLERALQDPETVKTIGEVRLLKDFMGASALNEMLVSEQSELGPILKELFSK